MQFNFFPSSLFLDSYFICKIPPPQSHKGNFNCLSRLTLLFTFTSLIHLRVVFVQGIWQASCFALYGQSVIQHHLLNSPSQLDLQDHFCHLSGFCSELVCIKVSILFFLYICPYISIAWNKSLPLQASLHTLILLQNNIFVRDYIHIQHECINVCTHRKLYILNCH